MYRPTFKTKKNGVPVLSKNDIEFIGENFIRDFCPKALTDPQPIDVEGFIEVYLGLKVDYQYLSSDGRYLGMMVFNDTDKVIIFDPEKRQADYLHADARTVLIDNTLLAENQEHRFRYTMGHEGGHDIFHSGFYAYNPNQISLFDSGENHVGGVVNPEIEPGERDQHRKKDAPRAEELLFCDEGDAAEEADRGLGMSAGEGVSCGGVYGVSDGREIGVGNPGAINAEDQLEELIEKRTDKADEEEIVAGALIQTPEEKKRYGEHPDFIAEVGQNPEKRISERGANAFKEMQNGHTILRKKQG